MIIAKLLLQFLKAPYADPHPLEISLLRKIGLLLKLALTYLVLTIFLLIICAISYAIIHSLGIHFHIHGKNEVNPDNVYAALGKYTLLITGVFGPLIEESIFRLPLSFRKRDVSISFFVIMGIMIWHFSKTHHWVIAALALMISCLFYFLVLGRKNIVVTMKITTRTGNYLVYISMVTFALFHLTNFSHFDFHDILFYLIFITPVFIGTVLITFCRMKLGFFYGIFFHSMVNVFVYGIMIRH
ncbi:hypothetical protein [Microbacter margulisiae]|uniref:Membrane protease YdiL (CAAX protease family) n=1 Tax=Microbacter margulisiae TaxID=1350067 RepID=A0A7W5DTF3_9PORP|nr:hypothetical protein [Microbacter margulisiae]MBB3188737.1 membrane protease YdiL (CAAX protease family) [Microbacter margulisiae]